MITTFDGNVYLPDYRVNDGFSAAQGNGLDSLMLVDRCGSRVFDSLLDFSLRLDSFEVEPVTARFLRASNSVGSLDVYRGEKVRTRQGEILVWAASQHIASRVDVWRTIDYAVSDGAHVVLSHPFSVHSFDHGLVAPLLDSYSVSDLSLDVSAQIAPFFGDNREAMRVASRANRVFWMNSGVEGAYMGEHLKLGEYLHNVLPFALGDKPHDALRALTKLPYSPLPGDKVNGVPCRSSGGRLATFSEVNAWQLDAVMRENRGRSRGTFGRRKRH